MKKTLISLMTILTLTGCSNNTGLIEGKVVGEAMLNPQSMQNVIFNLPQGVVYSIKDNSGKVHFAVATNGQDPLNEGDKGSFKLGEELFSGSFDRYVDGQRKKTHFKAYQLEGYVLK